MQFHQEKKTWQKMECLVIDKLLDGKREIENEFDIADCLNRNFQKLGLYNEQNFSAPNISRVEIREKFCFITVTLKELFEAIYSLDNNKSPVQTFLMLGQSRQ